MGADHGSPQLPAVASVRELGAEAMPPLWQYFSQADTSPSLPPKGTDPLTLQHFPCKPAVSRDRERGHIAFLDP
jgi:hypothetical protein